MRTYLQNRNGIYYFRCRVPLKYQSSFNGKSEIRQSLLQKSTKNALILSNIFKSLLQELYMLLDHADAYFAQRLVSEFLNNLKNEVEKNYYANKNTLLSSLGKIDKYQIKDSLLYYERLHDAHSCDSNIAFEIQELLDEKNIKLSPDSTQY
jgi:hypothetical protein